MALELPRAGLKVALVNVGGFLATLGMASIVVRLMSIDARVLVWLDARGRGFGWATRLTFILVGAALYALGKISWSRRDGASAEVFNESPTGEKQPDPAPVSPPELPS